MLLRPARILTAIVTAAALSAVFVPEGASAAPATGHRTRVVQLGDSYSAGNGAGDYTDTTCYRSPHNYGQQFASSIRAKYVNRACSGAVVRDLLHATPKGSAGTAAAAYDVHTARARLARWRWLRHADAQKLCGTPPTRDLYYARHLVSFTHVGTTWNGTLSCQLTAPPQVRAVGPHTDVVLLTIGGNDIGFSTIVATCLALRDATSCKGAIDQATAALPAVSTGLRQVFKVIRHRSLGHAKVYLLPYPSLLDTDSYQIPEGTPTYDAGKALADLQALGNKLQRRAVGSYNRHAGHGRYHWVRPVVARWAGHGLDPHFGATNAASWLHPIGEGITVQWVHPRPVGWDATASALESYFAGHH